MTMTETFTGEASADPMYWATDESDSSPVLVALQADGAPMHPPRTWFDNPGFRSLAPLEITSDGHIRGHIASWKQSHIGMAGSIKAPKSRSNYAFFATGALQTAEGDLVDVGQITLSGGHAPLDVDVPRAVAHYDDTRSGVADVAIGEDKHGIWVAGALRPDVDELKIRKLRASGVSGDWRPINGNLELVAVCSVNVPGFPVPRARVASGHVYALVACGVEPIIQKRIESLTAAAVMEAVDAVSDRVGMLEGTVLDFVRPTAKPVTASTIDPAERASSLRRRVRPAGDPLPAPTPIRASGSIETREELVGAITASAGTVNPRAQSYLVARARKLDSLDVVPTEWLPPKEQLRARVFGVTAAGKFDPTLHPRGRDGKFIEVGGFVTWLTGKKKNRGQVTKIKSADAIDVKDSAGKTHTLKPSSLSQAAATRANLGDDAPSIWSKAQETTFNKVLPSYAKSASKNQAWTTRRGDVSHYADNGTHAGSPLSVGGRPLRRDDVLVIPFGRRDVKVFAVSEAVKDDDEGDFVYITDIKDPAGMGGVETIEMDDLIGKAYRIGSIPDPSSWSLIGAEPILLSDTWGRAK